MSEPPVNAPPRALLDAIQRILRPFVYLLLRFQITFPLLSQILKRIYVQVVVEDFPVEGKKLTDSRITMLTGVHRKDVRAFRQQGFLQLETPKTISLGSQITGVWLSADEYTDKKGHPLPLHRIKAQGEPSFETLVESVTKQDLRARSVLDEWLRLGVCSINENDQVILKAEAFIPEKGFDEKAFFLGKNLHDHIATSVHNVLDGSPPQFDRSVYYNNLSPESMQILSDLIDEKATEMLKLVNKRALGLQKKDSAKQGNKAKFNFGLFYYKEEQTQEGSDGD